ncbi:MAG: Hsp20/alpha crystallin family protein [Candidatus Bathyarchaeota archaeon]|nr:Hsp20/alpha crystallin family protein [Candidatus Bathyarchaeota archaeon]
MSARWKRSIKNRKWLDISSSSPKPRKTQVSQTRDRSKSVPLHASFRPSKSYAKAKEDQKPLIDIFQENNYITVVAEIAGFNRETLKIHVKDQKLTLSAKSKERRYYKSLNLPKVVIPNAMHTKYKNGVLEIRLRKAETIGKEADQNAT